MLCGVMLGTCLGADMWFGYTQTCPTCNGYKRTEVGLVGIARWHAECPDCDGTGKVAATIAYKLKAAKEKRQKKGWPVPPSGTSLL